MKKWRKWRENYKNPTKQRIYTPHRVCAHMPRWRDSAIEEWWDNFLHVYYSIGPGISASTQVIILYEKITISITVKQRQLMAVHPPPAFLLNPSLHSDTVSPGSGEEMETEVTWIIDYLKTMEQSSLLLKWGRNGCIIYLCIYSKTADSSCYTVVLIYSTDGKDDVYNSLHGKSRGSIVFIKSTETNVKCLLVFSARSIKSYLKLLLWATWKNKGALKPWGFPGRPVGGRVVSSEHAGLVDSH